MRGNKYNNFLTVLLVIAIIAIIVLLVFFGYDVFNKYSLNKGAEEAISRFDDAIQDDNEPEDNGQYDEIVESPLDSVNNPDEENSNNENTNKEITGTTYQGYTIIGKIKIPEIDIEYPILEKVTKKSIQIAVAVLYGSGLNKPGNTVIVGHNYRNGTFFSNISKLKEGDKIYITDTSGEQIEYTVYKNYETTSDDTKYMTRDTEGKREISLSTCVANNNDYRTIILAKEE